MLSDYHITYQTEDGLVKQTIVQAKTKKEADEKTKDQLKAIKVIHTEEGTHTI
ncbi:hypothetical protein [Virgibacillus ainsalahensis]